MNLRKLWQCPYTFQPGVVGTTPRSVSADSLLTGRSQYPGGREQVCDATEILGPGTYRRVTAADQTYNDQQPAAPAAAMSDS